LYPPMSAIQVFYRAASWHAVRFCAYRPVRPSPQCSPGHPADPGAIGEPADAAPAKSFPGAFSLHGRRDDRPAPRFGRRPAAARTCRRARRRPRLKLGRASRGCPRGVMARFPGADRASGEDPVRGEGLASAEDPG